MNSDWTCYFGTWLLNRPPHSDNSDIDDKSAKSLLRNGGWFARWTTNFDNSCKKEWWWCIKDDEIDLNGLTAKQRYRVNKGLKNIDVIRITGNEAKQYAEDLYNLAIKKLEEYPAKYRPNVDKGAYINAVVDNADKQDYWICKDKESGDFCGYAKCMFVEDTISLAGVKVLQPYMGKEVNAVLVYKICEYYINQCHKRYVCDGERNVKHETSYQEFLCRVLNFRYAYCDLHIVYKPIVGVVVKALYPFRMIIKKFSNRSQFVYNIYCTLEQERIARLFK